jgi:hypothetical protein
LRRMSQRENSTMGCSFFLSFFSLGGEGAQRPKKYFGPAQSSNRRSATDNAR